MKLYIRCHKSFLSKTRVLIGDNTYFLILSSLPFVPLLRKKKFIINDLYKSIEDCKTCKFSLRHIVKKCEGFSHEI